MPLNNIKKYALEKSPGRLAVIYNKTDCIPLKVFLRIMHPLKTSKAFSSFYFKKEKIDSSRA